MTEPAPKPEQAASQKTACVHCGYDLRDTAGEGKCPECGNPATDTREGTLFYHLPPTRLGTITTGAALVCAMHAFCFLFAAFTVAWRFIPAGRSDAFVALWDAAHNATQVVYAPWIALFVLSAPLNRLAAWGSPMRVAAIVVALLLVVFETGLNHHYRALPPTNPGRSTGQIIAQALIASFGYVPAALASIQLHRISLRLPGSPFASIGSLSVVCSVLMVVCVGVESSGVLDQSALPRTGFAALTVLLWAAPTVFPFLVYRELRAVARDVDADHPYTRV
jgi:hypothetical protein